MSKMGCHALMYGIFWASACISYPDETAAGNSHCTRTLSIIMMIHVHQLFNVVYICTMLLQSYSDIVQAIADLVNSQCPVWPENFFWVPAVMYSLVCQQEWTFDACACLLVVSGFICAETSMLTAVRIWTKMFLMLNCNATRCVVIALHTC